MKEGPKKFLKNLVPPAVLRAARGAAGGPYGFFGDYKSWADALCDSKGYADPDIVGKVLAATMKVENGEAAYERDSVLFDAPQYSWPVLAALLWAASVNGNRLFVMDFGGSLGSSYRQNRYFLSHVDPLTWNVVEQAGCVEAGKRHFEDERLRFYPSIADCLADNTPDVALLSSVVQYLPEPHALLDDIVRRGFRTIIVDRTPLVEGVRDRLTVQKVPPSIYDASYPAWFLERGRFLSHFRDGYEPAAEFDALAGEIDLGDVKARDKGFIFRKRS